MLLLAVIMLSQAVIMLSQAVIMLSQAGTSHPAGVGHTAILCRGRRLACLLAAMGLPRGGHPRCCTGLCFLALVTSCNEGSTPPACYLMSAAHLLKAAWHLLQATEQLEPIDLESSACREDKPL